MNTKHVFIGVALGVVAAYCAHSMAPTPSSANVGVATGLMGALAFQEALPAIAAGVAGYYVTQQLTAGIIVGSA